MEMKSNLENKSERILSQKEKILSTMVHGFILGWINTWKKNDLYEWVNKGLYPDIKNLFIYFSKLPGFSKIRSGIQKYYFENQQKVLGYFSYEELLWQIHEHRQDLKDIANSENGKIWFSNLIGILRDVFLKDIAGIEWWKT